MPGPDLSDIRVLVTRPLAQAQGLSSEIRRLGGLPVSLPLLNIEPLKPDSAPDLAGTDVLLFVSANAVEYGLGYLPAFPPNLRVGAIGQATAARLSAAGCRVDLLPPRYDSEGLLALPAMQAVQGKVVLIVRGRGGREALAESLRARGARVTYLEVYRRLCPQWRADDVKTALSADVITVTSGEALDNLAQLARLPGGEAIWSKPLVVFHARIAGRAHELGFTLNAVVSEKPGDDALLAALLNWIHQQKGMEHA